MLLSRLKALCLPFILAASCGAEPACPKDDNLRKWDILTHELYQVHFPVDKCGQGRAIAMMGPGGALHFNRQIDVPVATTAALVANAAYSCGTAGKTTLTINEKTSTYPGQASPVSLRAPVYPTVADLEIKLETAATCTVNMTAVWELDPQQPPKE